MESCLYEGWVCHRRRTPVAHQFAFPLAMLYVDLDELPELFRGSWLWSAERPAFAWLRRRDHLGDPRRPLADCVRDLVEEHTGRRPNGPIRLLTHPRTAGLAMNPVSFHWCFDRAGRRVEALVADVTNTPWRERHCYVVARSDDAGAGPLRAETAKRFHVSPFMPMDQRYLWRIGTPGTRLALAIESRGHDGARVFTASLAMRRVALSARERTRILLRHPLMTWRVLAAIYWQALRLYAKGTPFHRHPHPPTRLARTSLERRS